MVHSRLSRQHATGLRNKINAVAMLQPQLGQIVLVDEHNVTPASHAAIAVVEPVDRGVVLVVAADRRQNKAADVLVVILIRARESEEMRLAVRGVDSGEVVTKDGEVIGTWSSDENDFYS